MKHGKILSLGLALVLTACGTSSSTSNSTTSANSTTTATPTPTPSGNINNLPAAYQTLVQLSGTTGSNPTFTVNSLITSHTLKVKIAPLTAPPVPGTPFSYPYACLSVQVTVDGSTQQSQPIPVNSGGYSSSCSGNSYAVLDFSGVMTGNNLGNGAVSISVHSPFDDNCMNSWAPLSYGCIMTAVTSIHMTALNLTVQTDGTWMDP